MREDTVIRSIREDFTNEELAEMGKKLAGKMADLETVASDKKAADATFNERKRISKLKPKRSIGKSIMVTRWPRSAATSDITIRRRDRNPSTGWTIRSTSKPLT